MVDPVKLPDECSCIFHWIKQNISDNIVCEYDALNRVLDRTGENDHIYAERADLFAKCGIYLSQQEFQELVL